MGHCFESISPLFVRYSYFKFNKCSDVGEYGAYGDLSGSSFTEDRLNSLHNRCANWLPVKDICFIISHY